jgi:hypothetical protein
MNNKLDRHRNDATDENVNTVSKVNAWGI